MNCPIWLLYIQIEINHKLPYATSSIPSIVKESLPKPTSSTSYPPIAPKLPEKVLRVVYLQMFNKLAKILNLF
jgi:hypothetical protein